MLCWNRCWEEIPDRSDPSYLPPIRRYRRTACDFVSGSTLRVASCLFKSNKQQAGLFDMVLSEALDRISRDQEDPKIILQGEHFKGGRSRDGSEKEVTLTVAQEQHDRAYAAPERPNIPNSNCALSCHTDVTLKREEDCGAKRGRSSHKRLLQRLGGMIVCDGSDQL